MVPIANRTNNVSHRPSDSSNLFCSNIPVIRPTAIKARGDVLTICL